MVKVESVVVVCCLHLHAGRVFERTPLGQVKASQGHIFQYLIGFTLWKVIKHMIGCPFYSIATEKVEASVSSALKEMLLPLQIILSTSF
jgi:hypothetical protein